MKPMDDARAALLGQLIEQEPGFDTLRAIERDAYEQGRAEGRREGLLEAAKLCDRRLSDEHSPEAWYCADDIRKLIEAEKGGGMVQLVESWRLGADGNVAEHKVACSHCGSVLSPKGKVEQTQTPLPSQQVAPPCSNIQGGGE